MASLLLTGGTCLAMDFLPIWAVQEIRAVERRGPELASGLLIYFHGYTGELDVTRMPIVSLFIEMATTARWDVLRINRLPEADRESDDDNILRFVADRISEARRAGYKQIIVAGGSRGGWLALLAATLSGVDAVIGIAPGTGSYAIESQEQTRDRLAQKLKGAVVRRIAAFFFDGDPGEDVPERRAVVIKRALQSTRSAFMIVDRPVDFYGHSGAEDPGFIRKYRDCLREFAESANPPAGEVQCSFPVSAAPEPPVYADPAFAPFWGHWLGTNEAGASLTMRAKAIRGREIVFQVVHSQRPAGGFERTRGERAFQLDAARRRIFCRIVRNGDLLLTATSRSTNELDVELLRNDTKGTIVGRFRAVLRKQSEEAANR